MPDSPVKEENEKKNLIPYVRLDATIVETDELTNSGNFLKLLHLLLYRQVNIYVENYI